MVYLVYTLRTHSFHTMMNIIEFCIHVTSVIILERLTLVPDQKSHGLWFMVICKLKLTVVLYPLPLLHIHFCTQHNIIHMYVCIPTVSIIDIATMYSMLFYWTVCILNSPTYSVSNTKQNTTKHKIQNHLYTWSDLQRMWIETHRMTIINSKWWFIQPWSTIHLYG